MKQYLLTEEEIQAIKDKWRTMDWDEVSDRWDEFYADFCALMDHCYAQHKIDEMTHLVDIKDLSLGEEKTWSK